MFWTRKRKLSFVFRSRNLVSLLPRHLYRMTLNKASKTAQLYMQVGSKERVEVLNVPLDQVLAIGVGSQYEEHGRHRGNSLKSRLQEFYAVSFHFPRNQLVALYPDKQKNLQGVQRDAAITAEFLGVEPRYEDKALNPLGDTEAGAWDLFPRGSS